MHFSVTQLLLILGIVIVLFGTKKLRNVGSDLGNAIKSFRVAMKDGESEPEENQSDNKIIDGEITSKAMPYKFKKKD